MCLLHQDEWVQQGLRLTPKGNTEVWTRRLSNGDTAVGLYNKNGASPGSPRCNRCSGCFVPRPAVVGWGWGGSGCSLSSGWHPQRSLIAVFSASEHYRQCGCHRLLRHRERLRHLGWRERRQCVNRVLRRDSAAWYWLLPILGHVLSISVVVPSTTKFHSVFIWVSKQVQTHQTLFPAQKREETL